MSTPSEHDLILRAKAGDARARAELVERFLPHIGSVAQLYRSSRAVHRTELLQEGVVGLLRALERFDPQRGVPFWSYAGWWVRQAMQQLVAELTGPVVLSDRALRHLARLKTAHAEALRETGREPSRADLIASTGLAAESVDDLLAFQRAPRSLDAPVGDDLGTFGDLLADPLAEDAYERVIDAASEGPVLDLLRSLSERDREILRARHEDDESLRSIGGRMGLSAERVRQLEQRALAKVRAAAGA